MKRCQKVLPILVAVMIISCQKEIIDPDADHNAEVAKIDEYLAMRGLTNSVRYDNNSGIRLLFNSYGQLPPPKPDSDQEVRLQYTGTLLATGAQFITTEETVLFDDIQPEGLKYCVGAMMAGTNATFYIPSKFGYGVQGSTNVPPNSTLIYNVTLQEVFRSNSEQNQFNLDRTSIYNYINTQAIPNAVYHTSGLWYVIEEEGDGEIPTVFNTVTVEYKLRLLSSPNTIIEQNTLTAIPFGLIDGFKVGLTMLPVGTKATLYIPSGLAYGPQGKNGIPPDSNLIFDLRLLSINDN